MFRNYNKNSDYNNSSNDNVFNISGQNIMSNNRDINDIIKENSKLKSEILKKNREIENAKKRINIIQREIENYKKQKNNNNHIKNRGKSVGMRYNNYNNNNYNEGGFFGGMFNNNDPFSDSFFQFQDEI